MMNVISLTQAGLIDRFRANLIVEGIGPFQERSWTEVKIGSQRFTVSLILKNNYTFVLRLHEHSSKYIQNYELYKTCNKHVTICHCNEILYVYRWMDPAHAVVLFV